MFCFIGQEHHWANTKKFWSRWSLVELGTTSIPQISMLSQYFLATNLYLPNDTKLQHSVHPWQSSLKLTEDDLRRVHAILQNSWRKRSENCMLRLYCLSLNHSNSAEIHLSFSIHLLFDACLWSGGRLCAEHMTSTASPTDVALPLHTALWSLHLQKTLPDAVKYQTGL